MHHTARAQSASADSDSVVTNIAPVNTIAPVDTVPQRDVFDVLRHEILRKPYRPPTQHSPGLHWSILPTLSYNSVYGVAVGAMIAVAGQRGGPDSHYSSAKLGANYSDRGQKQVYLRGDLFSKSEGWLFVPDLRWLDTDRKTWGLGSFDADQQKYPMSFVLSRIYATLYRRTVGQVYIGAGYRYEQFAKIKDERANQGEETPFTTYSGGAVAKTVAAGFSANLLVDTRDNEVTPTRGAYLSTSWRDYLKSAGSDTDWTELWAELRLYSRLPHTDRNVLGLWLYGWGTTDKPPYLDLPSSGWDTFGRGARGYVHGRIRGQDQLYGEVEYRRTLTANGLLGAVAFA
ncbi:MAG TPA: hypothetical protein VJS69_00355, partial [Candidatus Krumholzibacteria bacterium]|nr:hypothetical protein [Candidatus Krumholzibacteria bacterium]